jgi:hydrogenase expression/formation protein HypE
MSDFPPGKLPHSVLDRLLKSYTGNDPRLIVPPALGEDAAVIDFGDRYLVAKTDPITFATSDIGWYAVHVNANDIAAMGATPRFFLATILIPADQATEALIESIFRSIYEAAAALDITVCGGHTEITPGLDRPLVIGQMLGEVKPDRLVRSSGLEAGDAILLTKGLGIEATAIIAHEKGPELEAQGIEPALLEEGRAFLHNPGISVVRDARIALDQGGVSALHDPTEGGVATGLFELAQASNVGLELNADALYLAPVTDRLCAAFNLDPLGVISSGALLIGCLPGAADPIITALTNADIRVDRIATVRPSAFGLQIQRQDALHPLPHFAVDEITRIFAD